MKRRESQVMPQRGQQTSNIVSFPDGRSFTMDSNGLLVPLVADEQEDVDDHDYDPGVPPSKRRKLNNYTNDNKEWQESQNKLLNDLKLHSKSESNKNSENGIESDKMIMAAIKKKYLFGNLTKCGLIKKYQIPESIVCVLCEFSTKSQTCKDCSDIYWLIIQTKLNIADNKQLTLDFDKKSSFSVGSLCMKCFIKDVYVKCDICNEYWFNFYSFEENSKRKDSSTDKYVASKNININKREYDYVDDVANNNERCVDCYRVMCYSCVGHATPRTIFDGDDSHINGYTCQTCYKNAFIDETFGMACMF